MVPKTGSDWTRWAGRCQTWVLAALVACCLGGCDERAESEPYFEFAGGGFIFNYRLAEAYYGFVARVKRKPPAGTVLEARFEDPAGGPPIVVRHEFAPSRRGYKFETPPLKGIEADRDYAVELRLLDPSDGKLLATYGSTFRTSIGQEVLPKEPLATGPGYHPPPDRLRLPDQGRGTKG